MSEVRIPPGTKVWTLVDDYGDDATIRLFRRFSDAQRAAADIASEHWEGVADYGSDLVDEINAWSPGDHFIIYDDSVPALSLSLQYIEIEI